MQRELGCAYSYWPRKITFGYRESQLGSLQGTFLLHIAETFVVRCHQHLHCLAALLSNSGQTKF